MGKTRIEHNREESEEGKLRRVAMSKRKGRRKVIVKGK